MTVIEILLRRLSKSRLIDKIVVVTSTRPENVVLINTVTQLGFVCEAGSENNVLERYILAGKKYGAQAVVRITADCPLLDPEIIDQCIQTFINEGADYASNTIVSSYPDGLDVEVISFDALSRTFEENISPKDLEHVTPHIRNSGKFITASIESNVDHSGKRWTLDYPEDLEVIRAVFKEMAPEILFGWNDVLMLERLKPEIFLKNKMHQRNTALQVDQGQALWRRAKTVIAGGNMLLSKRPEMFLPGMWPTYFSRTSDCRVWDLDGKEYLDMATMGVGTNILGYSHPEVDEAVLRVIKAGNVSSLNCPEEVYLAEKLIELHPWAEMTKLARTGGEANAVAVRIARAATGKDKVAICGYHGWHDWYLSTNLADGNNLNNHLLPGLSSRGVPKGLTGTTLPFFYNDIESLETILSQNDDVAAIKMEVSRNTEPSPGFLERVRELATLNNAVLIFDECTSGFRETYGGLHKKYGINPDMAVFGKALGNGYAITAIIGRRAVMDAAQSTFVSSTFWTERIGPAAALATLRVMGQEESWDQITSVGREIRNSWRELADMYSLKLECWGIPALSGFTFDSKNALAYKTLVTQIMLENNVLAGNSIYVTTAHQKKHVDRYFTILESIFVAIKRCEDGSSIDTLLKGPICHSGFSRLN
jgi:glutamate-1-semialdehyde 2,1-aminomutase